MWSKRFKPRICSVDPPSRYGKDPYQISPCYSERSQFLGITHPDNCYIDQELTRIVRIDSNSGNRLLYKNWPHIKELLATPHVHCAIMNFKNATYNLLVLILLGCNWACKLTDGCSLKSCVRPHLQAYMKKKSQLNCMQCLRDWVKGYSINVSYIYIYIIGSQK